MSRVARKRVVFGCAFAAVLGALLLWFLIVYRLNTSTAKLTGTGQGSLSGVSEPLTIEGTAATPMSPGVGVPLNLRFTNPYSVTTSVSGLLVRIQTINAPNADDAHQCALRDFTVEQVAPGSPELTLAPGVRSSLGSLGVPTADWPRVGMVNRLVNQDGCKGASLTLVYSATGRTNP